MWKWEFYNSDNVSNNVRCSRNYVGILGVPYQNHMKMIVGAPLEEVVFTDQQLCQTGVRAVGAA